MKQAKMQRPAPIKSGKKKRGPQSAQQTIPYVQMLPDGICKVREGFYTKSIEYDDINYAVASSDDQATIFDGYCAFLNYFDSALPFQLSFINHRSRPENRYSVNIPPQSDALNSIRAEYVDMLTGQIARSNNGITRSKYITFGISAEGISIARPRLERVEADIMGNFKKLGVQSRPLPGRERLEVLHGQLHPGGREPFRFSWDMIPKTGMGTKDFIAPTSFDFRQSRAFRVGTTWGAASYMQIMASELSDKLLAELLEVDAEMTVTLHVQTVDQSKAIKTVKAKLTDIDRTHEVIPAIRKHGGYLTPAKIEEVLLNPDTIIHLATALKDEQAKNKALALKAEADKPLVLFAKAVSTSDETILIGELAKILKGNGVDIGQNRLFERLRADGYLIKRRGSDYNMPTQMAMELGLFKVKETAITHSDGHITISKTTKVTGKGQQYFVNLFLKQEQAV